MNISKHHWMLSSFSLFKIFLLTSSLLQLCEGESIFFKKDDIFTISGNIEPDRAIFFKNDSLISVNDNGKSLTLTCKSSCPVEWRLENFRLLSFPEDLKNSIQFRTERKVSDFYQPVNYEYIAEMKISTSINKVTGNYICKCSGMQSPQRNTSIYVYWEGSSPSYLLQAGEHQTITRSMHDEFVRFDCGASKPDQKIFLHRIDEFVDQDRTFSSTLLRSTATLMTLNDSVRQDVNRFTLNIRQLRLFSGDFICSLKSTLAEHDIAADGRSSTLQKRITIRTKSRTASAYHRKQITSYRDMSRESDNSVFYDHSENRLICCHKHTETHEQLGYYCENPLQCNFFKYRLTSGHNANEQNDTCTAYKIGKQVYSGAATFRCIFSKVDAKMDLDVRGEQFFSLKSDTYFGLEEADPSRMVQIKLENLNSTLFYGQPLRFKCETASYPFSQGIIWVLKKIDGSQTVVYKEQESQEYKVEQSNSDSEITLRILNDKVNQIECYAPLWNSDKWWSSRISLNLSESRKPMIVGDTDVTFRINANDQVVTAECKATGIPKPQIKWRKDKKYFQPNVHIIESSQDTVVERIHITLIDINKNEFDSYDCVAVNAVGEALKTFHLRSKVSERNILQIIGISVGVLVLFIIIMIFLLRKIFVQRRALRHLTKAEIEEFEKGKPEALANWKGDTNGCSHLLPYNQAYEIPRIILHIDEGKILGQGTYGIVMKGYLKKGTRNEKVVAVKTIKPNEDVMHFKILLCELKIMAFIGSHPHIVSLVGACSRDIRNRELLVAIEYCDNGNMHDYLRKCRESYNNLFVQYDKKTNKISTQGPMPNYANFPHTSVFNVDNRTKLDSKQLLVWASEIASGMEFLSSKKVIHGDLAARNILLSAENTAKIGDFGLSKQIFEYTTYTKKTIVLLPWKWMSIESLQDMTFSVMSDVWSYGVTLWEMFTLAQIPYPGTSWDDEFIDKLISDYRLPQPQFASKEIYEVMLMCWARRPEYRPSFTDLKEKFTNFVSELQSKINQAQTPNR